MKIPTSSSSENSSNPHQVNDDQFDETGNGSTNGSHDEDIRQTQRHEEAMFGAVDRFCNASEQTYEEFLTCFSYFRPGESEVVLSYYYTTDYGHVWATAKAYIMASYFCSNWSCFIYYMNKLQK